MPNFERAGVQRTKCDLKPTANICPSYLDCRYLIPCPGAGKSIRKYKIASPDADLCAEVSQLSLKCLCSLSSVLSGRFMMLRFLFQMVLNFQIYLFTNFLQTLGYLVMIEQKSQILIQTALNFRELFFFA